MVMPRPSSSGLQSIRREVQRRKHKAAAAPTRPASKNTSAPPLREGARDLCSRDPRPRTPPEEHPSPTISRSSGSVGTLAPPPPRRPRPSSAASAPPASPQSRSASSPVGYACAAAPNASSHLKPGTAVVVRTRSQMVIDGRILVLWLPATVASAADDGGYEVIYEGNLPRDKPFAVVRVPLHHVRPVKPSLPTPPPLPSCPATVENQGTQPAPRPTTAGKSMRVLHTLAPEMRPAPRPTTEGKSSRLISNLAPEMRPAPRPTTAGKSIHVIRRIMAEKERHALGACGLGY